MKNFLLATMICLNTGLVVLRVTSPLPRTNNNDFYTLGCLRGVVELLNKNITIPHKVTAYMALDFCTKVPKDHK